MNTEVDNPADMVKGFQVATMRKTNDIVLTIHRAKPTPPHGVDHKDWSRKFDPYKLVMEPMWWLREWPFLRISIDNMLEKNVCSRIMPSASCKVTIGDDIVCSFYRKGAPLAVFNTVRFPISWWRSKNADLTVQIDNELKKNGHKPL